MSEDALKVDPPDLSTYERLVKEAEGVATAVLVDGVVSIQDTIALLREMEGLLCIAVGRREGQMQGNVGGGRQFTLKRTADRKAWDHKEWKRDARRAIVKSFTDAYHGGAVVDEETGEATPLGSVLQRAITEAQEVHGSTNPRTTQLKRLGLYAGDYCESSPGGWKLDAIRPEPKKDTTDD